MIVDTTCKRCGKHLSFSCPCYCDECADYLWEQTKTCETCEHDGMCKYGNERTNCGLVQGAFDDFVENEKVKAGTKTKEKPIKQEKEHYHVENLDRWARMFKEPVREYAFAFARVLKPRIMTISLQEYTEVFGELYTRYHTGKIEIDSVLMDIYESCIRISQLEPSIRDISTMNFRAEEMSDFQRKWLTRIAGYAYKAPEET
jgi:hypothetical protein